MLIQKVQPNYKYSYNLKSLKTPVKTTSSFGNEALSFKGKFTIQDVFTHFINEGRVTILPAYDLRKNYGFNKFAGMKELKQILRDDIINPLLKPDLYKKYGIDQINGCLLYGPPGCGKTLIANALAEEAGRALIEITPSNVGSKYQHLTSHNIAAKFQEAKSHTKSIVFIDEAEALLPSREYLPADNTDYPENIAEVLTQINNSKLHNMFVVLASNEPQKIDPAIKRAGRIDKKIYIGPPDTDAREEIFKTKLENLYKEEGINCKLLAENTENYIAEDIRMILRKAGLNAMHENVKINEKHILDAIKEVPSSLNENLIKLYKAKGDM